MVTGDLKFIYALYGLKGATSNFPCFACYSGRPNENVVEWRNFKVDESLRTLNVILKKNLKHFHYIFLEDESRLFSTVPLFSKIVADA